MRCDSGQASSEYIAVTAVVAVVLMAAVALTSGGIGSQLESAIRRGICLVSGGNCPAKSVASVPHDLAPCPILRTDSQRDLSLDIGFVRLAGRLGLSIEQRSDRTVRVSFADGARAGLGAAVGAHIGIGRSQAKAEGSIDLGLAVTAGRVWVLPNVAAAKRFVAKFGDLQRPVGRLRAELERLCPVCTAVVGARLRPPRPDERWIAGGLAADSQFSVGAGPASAQLNSALRGAIGRRQTAAGTSWFMRLDDQVSGLLDAVGAGLDGQVERHAVAALELDRGGAPQNLRITIEDRLASRRNLRIPRSIKQLLGGTTSGSGQVIESELLLPLTDPRSREQAISLVTAIGSADLSRAANAARSLASTLQAQAVRTIRRWQLTRSGGVIGAGAALGVRLGIDGQSRNDDQRLVAVATRLPGLDWLPRADCLAV